FMRSHPDAGAMGVKMTDGSGRYLRESKRAIPYPAAAFYKMTGLSSLFPRSPVFSSYYMEHLDRDNTSQIEVLPGAFMFLRKSTIGKAGFFDENYFMYGEDIDLSYRIIKAGFKIYYFPEVTIIHYKGKSSKKNPVKSVVSFYRAMLIFTRKHFSGNLPLPYYLILRLAVYSASVAGIFLKITRYFLANIFSGRTNNENEISYLKDLYKASSPVLVAASRESFKTITEKIKRADIRISVAGRIRVQEDEPGNESKGDIGNLMEIIRTEKAKSVIFSLKSLGLPAAIKSANSITEQQTVKCIVPD
ncbi:MAG: glycosyltransferase family 2 protein, partial [Bacteroidales bacterium]|nr:glycosyltransferase family 2 protein [Bacteroidales bacterium]